MRISLKVDADDFIGIKEGIPALLKLFDQYNIQASFYFSTGYDTSGQKIKSLFRPKILSGQLPLKQKLYGTLLAPPNISKKLKKQVLSCKKAGHEVAIKGFDGTDWLFSAARADIRWTQHALNSAIENFADIFDEKPSSFSANNFQVNNALFELEEKMAFKWAVDTRGKTTYLPHYQGTDGNIIQIPVTLPDIEDLLEQPEINLENVHEYLFVESQKQLPHGHVYNIRAAYEGREWLSILEKMIVMWRNSQWEFQKLQEIYDSLDKEKIYRHRIGWQKNAGKPYYEATQSLPVGI